jgi:hypothetical protein
LPHFFRTPNAAAKVVVVVLSQLIWIATFSYKGNGTTRQGHANKTINVLENGKVRMTGRI